MDKIFMVDPNSNEHLLQMQKCAVENVIYSMDCLAVIGKWQCTPSASFCKKREVGGHTYYFAQQLMQLMPSMLPSLLLCVVYSYV
jgi:hypothetical protein